MSSFLESDSEGIKDLNKRLNYPKFQPSYVSDGEVKIIQTIIECSGNQGFLTLSAFRENQTLSLEELETILHYHELESLHKTGYNQAPSVLLREIDLKTVTLF